MVKAEDLKDLKSNVLGEGQTGEELKEFLQDFFNAPGEVYLYLHNLYHNKRSLILDYYLNKGEKDDGN